MEINSNLENGNQELSRLSIEYLKEIAKWGTFLSIVGFIFTGIFIITALFLLVATPFMQNDMHSPFGNGYFSIIFFIVYIFIGAFYFFPCYYLLRSSTNLKKGILIGDIHSLENGFKYQKSMFKFIGISTIVVIGFYVFAILISFLGAGFSQFL